MRILMFLVCAFLLFSVASAARDYPLAVGIGAIYESDSDSTDLGSAEWFGTADYPTAGDDGGAGTMIRVTDISSKTMIGQELKIVGIDIWALPSGDPTVIRAVLCTLSVWNDAAAIETHIFPIVRGSTGTPVPWSFPIRADSILVNTVIASSDSLLYQARLDYCPACDIW